MDRKTARDLAILHIEEHQAAFDELQRGGNCVVRSYFEEYDHIPDIYRRLCSDLGLKPRKGAK